MPTPRISAIWRAMRPAPGQDPVHFHYHLDGQPFACDVARCESPAVTLDELNRSSTPGR
jgi:hypothetical protein